MTAASLALSVLEKWLFAATCAVNAGSCVVRVVVEVGVVMMVGKLCKPALVNWGLYSFVSSQLGLSAGP
jgi:hypothetical protein